MNVNGIDRILRFIVGFAILYAVIWRAGDAKWFGPLGTVLFRFCSLYSVFGLNSCPMKWAPHAQTKRAPQPGALFDSFMCQLRYSSSRRSWNWSSSL